MLFEVSLYKICCTRANKSKLSFPPALRYLGMYASYLMSLSVL